MPNSQRYACSTSPDAEAIRDERSSISSVSSLVGGTEEDPLPAPEDWAGLTSLGELHSTLYRRRSGSSGTGTHNSVATGDSKMFGDDACVNKGSGESFKGIRRTESIGSFRGHSEHSDLHGSISEQDGLLDVK